MCLVPLCVCRPEGRKLQHAVKYRREKLQSEFGDASRLSIVCFTLGLFLSDLFFRCGFRLHHLFLCGQTDLTLNTSLNKILLPLFLTPAVLLMDYRHYCSWPTSGRLGGPSAGGSAADRRVRRPTVAACWLIKQRSRFPFGIFTFTTDILLLLHEHVFKNVIQWFWGGRPERSV